jgi:diguanylate cyclase (GGDEF)-like protein/PAS domain S-box-containing protein
MTYQNYKVIENLTNERYDRYQETIETSITSSINKYQDISIILDNLIDGRLENCTNEMLNTYRIDKDVEAWDLDIIKEKYQNLHIYIVDRDLTIINTTDRQDLGLDFKKYKVLAKKLYNILGDNKLYIDNIDLSIKSGKLKKYSYMSTPDNKYIFELGVDVEKELMSDLPMGKIGEEFVKDIDFVDSIAIYKVDENKIPFRKLNRQKKEKFVFPKDELEFVKKAINTNETVEFKDMNSQEDICTMHRFVPINVYDKHGAYDYWRSYVVEIEYNDKELMDSLESEWNRTLQTMILIVVVYGVCMVAIRYFVRKSSKSSKTLQKIIDTTNEGFCLMDMGYNIIDVNDSLTRILGYSKEDLMGYNVFDYLSEDSEDIFRKMDCDAESKPKQFTMEREITSKYGKQVYVRIQATALLEDNMESLIFAFVHDITEEKKVENYIKHLAYHDSLTNLPNRKYMETKITERYNLDDTATEFAIMFLDLDDFKHVNDNYGHDTGDMLLKLIADRITKLLPEEDMIARIGGDEFIILTSKNNVISTADMIYEKLSKEFIINGHSIKAKLSIGIAYYPEDGDSVEDIIKKADNAMYVSKRNGKNNYIIYDDIVV